MATKFKPISATLAAAATQNQRFRMYVRKKSDPDTDASYTQITDSLQVQPDGKVVLPQPIADSLLPDTEYVLKFIHRLDPSNVIYKEVRTGVDFIIGDNPLKMKILYPGQALDIFEGGLLTSALPGNMDNFYYWFEANFRDAYAGFANALPTGSKFTTASDWPANDRTETAADFDDGRFIKMNNDHPDEEARITMYTLCDADGSADYTRFITFYIKTDTVDARKYLYWSGTDTDHVCAYINTDKTVTIEHTKSGVTQSTTTSRAVASKKWYTVEMRYNGTPGDNYFYVWGNWDNIDFVSPTNIVHQPNGTTLQPVWIGTKDGITTASGMLIKRFFNTPNYITDPNFMYRLRSYNDYLPKVVFEETANPSNKYTVPRLWMLKLDDSVISTALPPDMPTGMYNVYVQTSVNERPRTAIELRAFGVRSTSFDINFEADFDNAMAQWTELFYGFRSQWGGANGGVNPELIYGHRGESALAFESHGDNYSGTIVGVEKKTEVDAWHNIPGDPKYGQPKIDRVGAVCVTSDYLGYGEFSTWWKMPPGIRGVAPALWFFHYQELYPSDPRWQNAIDNKGVHPYGNEYLVLNNEIDIEWPSHLIMGEFAHWGEQAIAYFDPLALDTKYHIGIGNLEPDAAKRGLFRLTNPAQPNLFASWTKVANTYQQRNNPSFDHIKFNNWIGERGSGNGWAYVEPDYEGEEYLALLTDLGYNYADGLYHKWTIKWFKNRTELWVDDVKVRENRAFVPYNGMRFTIGPWFPSAASPTQPWTYNPINAWAGFPADWEAMQIYLKRVQFIPYNSATAGGTVELAAETYPEAGLRTFNL